MEQNINFQLGLLNLLHLIVNVDGNVDEREREAMKNIRQEENISETVFEEFEKNLATTSEEKIYEQGLSHLSKCTDEERLTAFVHLYRLAEADRNISSKEIRFLFYGLKETKLSFEDVILSAGMTN
jgi:Tellurite resistance protein TerB.